MAAIRSMTHGLLALTLALLAYPAMATEEPAFKLVSRDGNVELRDYPELVVAEATVAGEQKAAASEGFRLLAGYIFGGNRSRESIAMTAPVAQTAASEKIAMTAPVAQTRTDTGRWIVRFTMPSAYTMQTLPVPNDARVSLRRLPPARMAVLRFSGLAQPDDVVVRSNELLAWVAAHRLRTTGTVTLAQYNPPWTLWFLRRNEVMVEIDR